MMSRCEAAQQCAACGARQAGVRLCSCRKVGYCNVGCQRLDWARHRAACPPILVRRVRGKGLGLVTTRLIRAGTRILQEKPLVAVNQNRDTTVVKMADVLRQFQKLSENDRQKYLSLYFTSDVSPKMVSLDTGESLAIEVDLPAMKIGQIFMANAVGLRKVGDMERCGVFPLFSRINHSCNPNSQFGPLSLDADELVVTASRDLPGNTEISINYVGDLMFASRAERQAGLEKWKFLCRCDICSLTSQELQCNEEIRARITHLQLELEEPKNREKGYSNALATQVEILDLMEKIRDEVRAAFPVQLMEMYALSELLKRNGEYVPVDPDYYKKKAWDVGKFLGPVAARVCRKDGK